MKLARQMPRYGYWRLRPLLSRRGHEVNVKRVYRLYVEESLTVRRKRRKRLVRDRATEPRLTGPNQERAMDFIVDGLSTGRMVRILSTVGAYTRECLGLAADTSLGSGREQRNVVFASFFKKRLNAEGVVGTDRWDGLRLALELMAKDFSIDTGLKSVGLSPRVLVDLSKWLIQPTIRNWVARLCSTSCETSTALIIQTQSHCSII